MKSAENKKRFSWPKLLLSLLLVLAIAAAGAVAAFFALVPQKAARYVLSNCELEYIYEETKEASPGDSAIDEVLSGIKESSVGKWVENVALVLKTAVDAGGRRGIICIEAGESISAADFFENPDDGYIFGELSTVPTDDIGYYRIKTQVSGKNVDRLLIVFDSIKPVPAKAANGSYTLWVGDDPTPEVFISHELTDATALSGIYLTKPDCSAAGQCSYSIEVSDRGGNTVLLNGTVDVIEDTEPPIISGAVDRTVIIGETVMYKDGVTVWDNRDQSNIELRVDISAVNPQQEGSYPVIFSATDSTGLTTTVTVSFTFEYSQEAKKLMQLDALVQPIIDSIIKDGMTEREKARAIYNWVHNKIAYTGSSKKTTWYDGAIRGLRSRSGDCFTYFSVSKALLNAVGIENVDVQRRESSHHPNSTHWWNMVYVDGCWWHFDATRRADGKTFFLVTTSELLEYSNAHNYSHDFDPEQYPKTP